MHHPRGEMSFSVRPPPCLGNSRLTSRLPPPFQVSLGSLSPIEYPGFCGPGLPGCLLTAAWGESVRQGCRLHLIPRRAAHLQSTMATVAEQGCREHAGERGALRPVQLRHLASRAAPIQPRNRRGLQEIQPLLGIQAECPQAPGARGKSGRGPQSASQSATVSCSQHHRPPLSNHSPSSQRPSSNVS